MQAVGKEKKHKGVICMTKKKKLFLVVVVLMFILVIDNLGQLSYLKLDEEQRINNTLEKEVFSTAEFNNGYICLHSETIGNEECLVFTYLKRELFGDTGFNLIGSAADSYSHYVNNTSYKSCYKLMLNNFSKYTIYFSCFKDEYDKPILVDGEEVKIHKLKILQNDEEYYRYFWFYLGKDNEYPTVE